MVNQHKKLNSDTGADSTDFGFQRVNSKDKEKLVREVFNSVAGRYDLMNDLMSAGIHRIWKRFTIELSAVRTGQTVLDIAGGTGDLTAKLSRLVGRSGQVILADINASMLAVGRDRLIDTGTVGNVHVVQCDAQYLPFPDNSIDCITIAFGLRNITDKTLALRSMERILKPGGRLLVLEFSKPINPFLEKVYDIYSFNILPFIGRLIADDEASYRYLVESIRKHPDQESLLEMMECAGFINCEYHNMTGGIVAVHKGIKV